MLFALANSGSDEKFVGIMQKIERAYWPESEYVRQKKDLPSWEIRPKPVDRIKLINDKLKVITAKICEKGLYVRVKQNEQNLTFEGSYVLPFMERYHEYFLARQWNDPIRDPQDDYKDILMLKEPKNDQGTRRNYSKNIGDYNHFLNVVGACARLMKYFSDGKAANNFDFINDKNLSEILAYKFVGTDEKMRNFMLLLAAFYHDLGKTVVYHRHAMEGAMIVAGHPTKSLYHLSLITKDILDKELTREDLLFIGDLLNHHDQFGTLSTGETGYIRLTSIIDGIKRYAKKYSDSSSWSRKLLFDLWLLNVADICVSINNKWNRQTEWFSQTNAEEKIAEFRQTAQWECLVHDFDVAVKLMEKHEKYDHSSNTLELQQDALNYSSRHVIERIRRLVVASVRGIKISNIDLDDNEALDAIVYRNIESLSDVAEFSRRFALIGQMDYSLGFFRRIAQRAALHVQREINFETDKPKTGWVHVEHENAKEKHLNDSAFLARINVSFFSDNFASTVIQIIDYLLFREKEVDQIRNFEFVEANTRLTDEKIDKILTLEGPYRSQKTIEQILKTIFIY